jgi:ribA/ribD-fused uncharacterized protein
METNDSIYFFGADGKFGYLSNFFKSPFIFADITFNCSEQYFMYQKCIMFDPGNKKLLTNIINETNPGQIKKYGRSVKNFDEQIWSTTRYNVMKFALQLKFNQNPNLKAQLLSTGNKLLYEASPYDKIWGIGYNAHDAVNMNKNSFGQNLLGKALMEIRNEIKN